ncbi:hypothetical protein Trydic_g1420 [Trypoxylus dichotomus]
MWARVQKDLCLHGYKIFQIQQLKPINRIQRRKFANWLIQQLNDEFFNKIIFSDEANFHANGFVNKQICEIWSDGNLYAFHEKEMHSSHVAVWCGFWADGIIEPEIDGMDFENCGLSGAVPHP